MAGTLIRFNNDAGKRPDSRELTPRYQPLKDQSRESTGGSGEEVFLQGHEGHFRRPWYCDAESHNYKSCIGIVIMANAIVIGLETDFGSALLVKVEWFFFVAYSLEFVMRSIQLKAAYWKDPWNVFDAFLVCMMYLEKIVIPFIPQDDSSLASALLSNVRLARVLRIFRLFRMFEMLAVILKAFIKALTVVMWVGLLMIIIDYVCAILMVRIIGKNAARWGSDEAKIQAWFGTIPKAMESLFVIMTLDGWSVMAEELSLQIPEELVWFCFMMYIIVVSYALTSLITGVISESLITAKNMEEKIRVKEIEDERNEVLAGLRLALERLDSDCSGTLSRSEIKTELALHPEVLTTFAMLQVELSVDDILALFDRLANGKTELSIPLFVDALSNLTGTAKAAALFDVQTEVKEMKTMLQQVQKNERDLNAKMDRMLDTLSLLVKPVVTVCDRL
eukprot:gnl/TRDRNA2_/TRDRNA2_89280_c0_seq1.p1 gnl/TRDRNA2_/TRDRNA2_89280_c0~~gnl/TRDRNA2_/TRDRNA2_89280_c0_seq1.p1  ORF type:complete len:458 (-),score=64.59 gnl/TRDRNA2_/TRDRNA2_89280_c0_seq1:81-1427(-)